MGGIIKLDEHRPKFLAHDIVEDKLHVVTVQMAVDIISGNVEISEVDPSVIRGFIKCLLEELAGD